VSKYRSAYKKIGETILNEKKNLSKFCQFLNYFKFLTKFYKQSKFLFWSKRCFVYCKWKFQFKLLFILIERQGIHACIGLPEQEDVNSQFLVIWFYFELFKVEVINRTFYRHFGKFIIWIWNFIKYGYLDFTS
jgi:hypothetical protein